MVFASCKEQIAYRIDDKVMVGLIQDLHTAQAVVQSIPVAERSSHRQELLRQSLERRGVSQEDFEYDMAQLMKDPERMEALYNQVIIELDSIPEHYHLQD